MTQSDERDDDLQVETAESLSNNLKDLIDDNSSETVYLEVPKVES